jgi:hypothetical protein
MRQFVSENKVLRRVFVSKREREREEVTGSWTELYKGLNLYPSPHIIRAIKPRTMRWAGRMKEMRYADTILVRKP